MSTSAAKIAKINKQKTVLSLQLDKVKVEHTAIEPEYQKLQAKMRSLKSELSNLDSQLKQIRSIEPTVTDHALLQYLERVHGIEMQDFRDMILTEDLKDKIRACGSAKIPIGDGFTAVVKAGAIVTIIKKG